MAKYKLTKNTITVDGHTLYQIYAMIDIYAPGGIFVAAHGELGGYVESEANLDQAGCCWVRPGGLVYEDAFVCGCSLVGGSNLSICVHGKALIQDAFACFCKDISGDTILSGGKMK